MSWHLWSKLNEDRNPSSPWKNGAGMKIREADPQTSSSVTIPSLYLFLRTNLPKRPRAPTLHLSAWSPSENACMLTRFSPVWLFVTPWAIACQTPPSIAFSRKQHQSEFPCPPPEQLPDAGTEPVSLLLPVLAGRLFPTSTTWEALRACAYPYIINTSFTFLTSLLVSRFFRDEERTSSSPATKPHAWK